MSHLPANPGQWPRMMRAETAAAYCDELSVEAFRKAVGVHYPEPVCVKGKGQRWLIEDLDAAIDKIAGREAARTKMAGFDAANLL